MEAQWRKRRAHRRRLSTGAVVDVRECWVPTVQQTPGEKLPRRSACPRCGASIVTMKMPNGGLAHFEGGAGLSKIKHPCFDQRRATAVH